MFPRRLHCVSWDRRLKSKLKWVLLEVVWIFLQLRIILWKFRTRKHWNLHNQVIAETWYLITNKVPSLTFQKARSQPGIYCCVTSYNNDAECTNHQSILVYQADLHAQAFECFSLDDEHANCLFLRILHAWLKTKYDVCPPDYINKCMVECSTSVLVTATSRFYWLLIF